MTENAQRYPLSWPTGWNRTHPTNRQRASFGKSVTWEGQARADGTREKHSRKAELTPADAARRLYAELDRLGATHAVLSTNQEVRADGTPRSDRRDPMDVGVAVYFRLNDKPRCLACDRWLRVADNIAAIAQHVDALRRIDRYGVGTMEQAFAGYAALPATAQDWAIVLGIPPSATHAEILAAHRRLALLHHPDKGGRSDDMARINTARDLALLARPE